MKRTRRVETVLQPRVVFAGIGRDDADIDGVAEEKGWGLLLRDVVGGMNRREDRGDGSLYAIPYWLCFSCYRRCT